MVLNAFEPSDLTSSFTGSDYRNARRRLTTADLPQAMLEVQELSEETGSGLCSGS